MMKKLDDYLIDKAQSIYLWLWDYVGVYLATVWFILLVIDLALPLLQEKRYSSLFVLGFFGAYCAIYYTLQDKKQFAVINKNAQDFREDWTRPLMTIVLVPVTIGYVSWGEYYDAVSCVFCAIFFFFKCVQLRDREPKEWFRSLKSVASGAI